MKKAKGVIGACIELEWMVSAILKDRWSFCWKRKLSLEGKGEDAAS